jgi:hypothetical protein
MIMKIMWVRASLVALILSLLGFALPAAAARADVEPSLINVLAAGDSFTAGVGGGNYYWDSDCVRSPNSWARQLVDMVETDALKAPSRTVRLRAPQ